jgi:hypothetical protein
MDWALVRQEWQALAAKNHGSGGTHAYVRATCVFSTRYELVVFERLDGHESAFGQEQRVLQFHDSRADYLLRIDIYSGNERVFTEALGPGGGWQLVQGATVATDLSEDGEKALTRGLIGNLYGLHELSKLNYTLSLSEIEAEDAESSWAIDQVGPDGHSKRLFMDQSSFLITRTLDTSALHPDIDATQSQTETRYADFETSSGVLFARLTEKIDTATAQVVQTVVVKEIDVNPTIDASRFDRPPRISP